MLAKLSKPTKLLLGLGTLWPLLYIFVFVFFLLITFAVQETPPATPPLFKVIAVLHILTILWIFGLLAIYIVDLFKTDRVDQDKKALWAVVLFLGALLAMPIYWYWYVWREPKGAHGA